MLSNQTLSPFFVFYGSSIGDGGFDASCAKNPTRKKCAKTTTQKNTGLTGNPKVKSQGQIFQECQGQISQGQMGKCNKNEKTKNT